VAATLVHELAHAWQSQHHPDNPMKFMWNCTMSQAEAAIVKASSNKWKSNNAGTRKVHAGMRESVRRALPPEGN
jgi:hypothetical protein